MDEDEPVKDPDAKRWPPMVDPNYPRFLDVVVEADSLEPHPLKFLVETFDGVYTQWLASLAMLQAADALFEEAWQRWERLPSEIIGVTLMERRKRFRRVTERWQNLEVERGTVFDGMTTDAACMFIWLYARYELEREPKFNKDTFMELMEHSGMVEFNLVMAGTNWLAGLYSQGRLPPPTVFTL